MHAQSVELLKDMFAIYKTSQKSKAMNFSLKGSYISQTICFIIWWAFVGLTVYGFKVGTEGWAVLSVLNIIALFVAFMIFSFNTNRVGFFEKFNIVFKTIKFLCEKLMWKLFGKAYLYFVKKKIKKVSKRMDEFYPKIHEFFQARGKVGFLQQLVSEMRLPKENTYDYSDALTALIYDFENTGLFPSSEDLINKMQQAPVVEKSEENITFFQAVNQQQGIR